MQLYLIVALAWLVSLGLTGWRAYEHGVKTEHDAVAAKLADDYRQKIEARDKDFNDRMRKHDIQVRRDIWAAIQLDESMQAKRAAAARGRAELERDIDRKNRELAELRARKPECPVRSCDLDRTSFGLLIDSIDRANGEAARGAEALPARGTPGEVRRDPEAERRR